MKTVSNQKKKKEKKKTTKKAKKNFNLNVNLKSNPKTREKKLLKNLKKIILEQNELINSQNTILIVIEIKKNRAGRKRKNKF